MRAPRVMFVLVVALLCTASALFATGAKETGTTGTAAMKQLSISIMTDLSGPPTKPPTEDILTPLLRQKTGVTATPFPEPTNLGTNAAAVAQGLIAGNNLPEIITESYFPPQVDGQQVLVDSGMVWDFNDVAFLKKMFPNFTSRLDQYGSFNDWYANEGTYKGTHIRITQNIDPKAFSKLQASMKGTTWARVNGPTFGIYSKMLRDDILKMIYPAARSDKEQEQFYLTKFDYSNPTGASDPWGDIPIKSMDDLYNYMKKAKEIIDSKNLMDGSGRDKMIVAQLNQANNNPPSIMWSNIGMYGYAWVEPPMRVKDKVYYNFQAPWVKGVLQWWNKLYNDGLLDPEVFIKKEEQLAEEITRGRFAIFNKTGTWEATARKFSKDNNLGYGYRSLANNWPLTAKSEYSDASNVWVTYFQHFGANIITKSVKEADLPQVAAWLDYHYSEEWDVLKSWGPASFYTGTGNDRRFKPEYKDLENFQVYGVTGGKDGYYYGINGNAPITLEKGTSNYETAAIGNLTNYPYAPRYVYPFKKVAGGDYDQEMIAAVGSWFAQKNVNYFPQVGWTNADLNNLPNFSKIQYAWFGTHGPAIAKAITDTPANFEKNYVAYQKVFDDNGYDAAMAEYQAKWTEVFDKYVKQYWK